jgi:hypothetical protein
MIRFFKRYFNYPSFPAKSKSILKRALLAELAYFGFMYYLMSRFNYIRVYTEKRGEGKITEFSGGNWEGFLEGQWYLGFDRGCDHRCWCLLRLSRLANRFRSSSPSDSASLYVGELPLPSALHPNPKFTHGDGHSGRRDGAGFVPAHGQADEGSRA